METKKIMFVIGGYLYTACLKGFQSDTADVDNTPENEAVETADVDMDCWSVSFRSKEDPNLTIEVYMGYGDDGNLAEIAYYAMIWDADGEEVDESVSVKIVKQ